VEQVLQKFEARPSNPEPQVRIAEVGATSKACKCSERSDKAITNRRTDDDVKLCFLLHVMQSAKVRWTHGRFPKCYELENVVQFFCSSC